MKNIVIAVVTLLISSACATSGPPSAVGLYGPNPVSQNIGSSAQASVSRNVEFTHDEVFEATKNALLRLGYNVEVTDKKNGMVAASGIYRCRITISLPSTMAVYIQQLNKKPETKFTVLFDRHDWKCYGGGALLGANSVATEIQKVLSTY